LLGLDIGNLPGHCYRRRRFLCEAREIGLGYADEFIFLRQYNHLLHEGKKDIFY